jgi:hypothetical protein
METAFRPFPSIPAGPTAAGAFAGDRSSLTVYVDPPVPSSATATSTDSSGRDPRGKRGHASKSVVKLPASTRQPGKVKWREPGFRNGVAITEADGLLFVRSYQTLPLVEATPDGYPETGRDQGPRLQDPDGEPRRPGDAGGGGRAAVRPDADELICFNVAEVSLLELDRRDRTLDAELVDRLRLEPVRAGRQRPGNSCPDGLHVRRRSGPGTP